MKPNTEKAKTRVSEFTKIWLRLNRKAGVSPKTINSLRDLLVEEVTAVSAVIAWMGAMMLLS